MVVFYSATGNSGFCAKRIAGLIGDRAVDSFNYIKDGIAGEFVSDTPWIFVSPTHGWRLPRAFENFIRAARFSGCAEAYFIMTCGTDIGNAGAHNRALCADKGLACRGTLGVVMPENYVAMFAVPQEAEAKEIVKAAEPELERAAAAIRHKRDFPVGGNSVLDKLKSGVVNSAFRRFIIKDRRFTVSGGCVSCGKCARVCPVNNIVLPEGKPVWGGKCTHCMACICSCPAGAIEYGRASISKPRYHCPETE